MKKYCPFGVAFDKRMMLHSGATPVHYVARNARHRGVGMGPRTVGGWFDQLRKEVQSFAHDLGSYVASHEGTPRFLFKLSPPDTPRGHRLVGQFSALQNDLEFLVFGQLKFFTVGLPKLIPTIFAWNANGGFPRVFPSVSVISPGSSCRGNSPISCAMTSKTIPDR